MRIPTFSRQSDTVTETEDRAPISARTEAKTEEISTAPAADERATVLTKRREAERQEAERREEARRATPPPPAPRTNATVAPSDSDNTTTELRPVRATDTAFKTDTAVKADTAVRTDTVTETRPAPAPVVAGPKPRASLLAMLGLITGVVAALLVLSGPLLGYGIGVAVLALVLSLAGIHATGKRHIAGKTDALLGMVLALGAIVVGVLALAGALSWLGTDMQPVSSLREWLDTQFVNRF
ncbi:hypothetical protein GCM10010435_15200 [Winogradskya consettensis]|uniref:Thrombospondin n=1 Tax=Winogradskya consettensis TaxID=113560 RepID=A0A919SCE9_9ACTN|nr:hypothetical protein [Actinoplanes consettensis]GIM69267.1 hypothetical protein Aco04nite_14480 [Actinoplanes consettensis]